MDRFKPNQIKRWLFLIAGLIITLHFLNFKSKDYLIKLSSQRIERLFQILHDKEKNFSQLMNHLGLFMFENLINGKEDLAFKGYEHDRDRFLEVVENRVRVSDIFINYLVNLSDFYSFKNPRNYIKRYTFNEVSKLLFAKKTHDIYLFLETNKD